VALKIEQKLNVMREDKSKLLPATNSFKEISGLDVHNQLEEMLIGV